MRSKRWGKNIQKQLTSSTVPCDHIVMLCLVITLNSAYIAVAGNGVVLTSGKSTNDICSIKVMASSASNFFYSGLCNIYVCETWKEIHIYLHCAAL